MNISLVKYLKEESKCKPWEQLPSPLNYFTHAINEETKVIYKSCYVCDINLFEYFITKLNILKLIAKGGLAGTTELSMFRYATAVINNSIAKELTGYTPHRKTETKSEESSKVIDGDEVKYVRSIKYEETNCIELAFKLNGEWEYLTLRPSISSRDTGTEEIKDWRNLPTNKKFHFDGDYNKLRDNLNTVLMEITNDGLATEHTEKTVKTVKLKIKTKKLVVTRTFTITEKGQKYLTTNGGD